MEIDEALTHACAASWIDVPLLDAPPEPPLPTLSIIVPARNEERSIENCVRSLLAQKWVAFEVIVVDDRSTDATSRILEHIANEDRRLRIVRGTELPDGWVGKPWALVQGAEVARGRWLLFTDADSTHVSTGAASALRFARDAKVDALSIATHQELGSFWERAILPSVLGMILFAAGPLGDINDPDKPEKALANGQYIMVSREAYVMLGGHAALLSEVVEDVEFAKRLKADGRYRMILAGGDRIASVRMYRSLAEIWAGFTKNVFLGAKGDMRAISLGVVFSSMISVLPPALAITALFRRRYELALEALATSIAIVATASWGMGRAAFPRRLALLQPLGTAIFAAIALNSSFHVLSGRGVEWSGRRYRAKKTRDTNAN
jgi:chlorobactene glucosyltransferase